MDERLEPRAIDNIYPAGSTNMEKSHLRSLRGEVYGRGPGEVRVSGGVGFLLGLVAVWWIQPTTEGGTVLVIAIFVIGGIERHSRSCLEHIELQRATKKSSRWKHGRKA